MLTAHDRIAAIRAALPPEGLFADKDWLLSPEPFVIDAKLAERLDATVVNMRFIKPLDTDLLLAIAARHRALVTLEENAVAGGAGAAVAEALAAAGVMIPLRLVGIPDEFIEHGSRNDCLVAAGLDPAGLARRIESWWQDLRGTPRRVAAQ